jgi:hypothetical protein
VKLQNGRIAGLQKVKDGRRFRQLSSNYPITQSPTYPILLSLSWWPVHRATAEQVQMDMENRLAGITVRVEDGSKAAC